MKRPNILFIMTDQMRHDAMSCSGTWCQTPHLDSLATEGIRFSHCITTTPVCVPARISLATGLYPHTTHVWDNLHHTLSPDAVTWMQAIRDVGYATSLFGKTHLHPHQGDLRDREHLIHAYGMEVVDEIGGPRASAQILSHMTARWQEKGLWEAYQKDYEDRFSNIPWVVRPSTLPLEEYADTYVGERAREYLHAYKDDRPWFCWVSFGGPHEPWDTPEPYASRFLPDDMPAPTAAPSWERDRPQGDLDRMLASSQKLSPEASSKLRADYAGSVALIDEQIGKIIQTVKDRGEWENTIVAFSSDHGELNGDHGLIYKSCFLDGCLRVPLLLRVPTSHGGCEHGSVNNSPAEWIDIGPTLAECAGATLTAAQYGVSLLAASKNSHHRHRRDALAEHRGEVCLFDEEWKGAINQAGELYLLFDRRKDPDEQNNLAGLLEHRNTAERIRLRILERIMQSQPQS